MKRYIVEYKNWKQHIGCGELDGLLCLAVLMGIILLRLTISRPRVLYCFHTLVSVPVAEVLVLRNTLK